MSRERTNVIGIVALTICVTAAALVGGWLAASRYLGLGQQTVTAAHEDAAGGRRRHSRRRRVHRAATAAVQVSRMARRRLLDRPTLQSQ